MLLIIKVIINTEVTIKEGRTPTKTKVITVG